MALTTYAELQASVAAWMDRTDLTTRIPDFILLTETDAARWLRVSWNEKRATSTPTSAFIALPDDYNGMRNIQWNYSDRRVFLEQLSPASLDQKAPFNASGAPAFYAIHDGQIELRPAPAADNGETIEITYYYKPDTLSDTNTSNIYLQKAPDLLLFGALVEASQYIMDEQKTAYWVARYDSAKAKILGQEEALSWPGELAMTVG